MTGYDHIFGNELIKKHLIKAVSYNRISHCYILDGEDGLGKMMFAEAFARSLQCSSSEEKPCNKCRSCIQMAHHNHPDVIYLQHEKPNTIGVDDIRSGLVNDILVKPYQGPYKIYIVDEAEKMSVEAQNALLKTMEEPPAYGILLLLTTNSETLLETIRSRSLILDLKPVSDEQVEAVLRENGVGEENISRIVKFARGNIGKALRMASSDRTSAMFEVLMNLLKNCWQFTLEQMLETVRQLSEYKIEINDCLDYIQMWYRDLLIFKATNDMNELLFRDEYRHIQKRVEKISYQNLEIIIDAIEKARRRLNANVNFELTMELLLLTMKENSGEESGK